MKPVEQISNAPLAPEPIRLPVIACRHWSGHEKRPGAGVCAIGAYPEPSAGVCQRVCPKYDGPERVQAPTPGNGGAATSAAKVVDRTPTARKILSFAKAALSGKYVSAEIVEERMKACGTCEFRRADREGRASCGICGCGLSAEAKRVTNLAAYEENLPAWGCKHPRRAQGAGWAR